jgi:hypothetical protein
VRIFREYDGQLSKPCEKSVSNALKIRVSSVLFEDRVSLLPM